MVYLLAWEMLLVVLFIIVKKTKLRLKKRSHRKIITTVFKGIVLCLCTSLLSAVVFYIMQFAWRKTKKTSEERYTVDKICVWKDEIYHEVIDPKSISKNIVEGNKLISPPELTNGERNEKDEMPQVEDMLIMLYDYSRLMLFGKYEFGEYITKADLDNMQNMYDEYWINEKYWDMLGEIGDDSVKLTEIDNRIGKFDAEVKANKNELTAEDFFRNAEDRLCRYGGKEENIAFLEQSAISAEGAVELKDVETLDDYEMFFTYIRATVVRFSCVLGSNCEQYHSGKADDIKFRMGKVMYKPSANLNKIETSEKYYSLCSAYVVLKDAFDYSTPDSTYAVEVAYYYLLVCSDIVKVMEPGQSQEMMDRVKLAYYQLYDRVREKSGSFAYDKYCEEADRVKESLEGWN